MLTFIVAALMFIQFMMMLVIWKILQTLKAVNITIGYLIRAQWPDGNP